MIATKPVDVRYSRRLIGAGTHRGSVAAPRSRGQIGLIFAVIFGAASLMHLVRKISASRRLAVRRPIRLNALRHAILGVPKSQIARVLGPPRATIGRGDYRADNTWYYPLDEQKRVALAIEFDRDIAKQTQVIVGEGLQTSRI